MWHITYVDDMQWIIRFVRNLYEIHVKTKSPECIEYFANFAIITEVLFKCMTTVYISSVFTLFPYPIYMYFVRNEVVSLLPMLLPFVDESHLGGYILLNTYQIIAMVLFVFGVLACDFFMTISIISTLIPAKLISLEMEQIGTDLQLEQSAPIIIKGRFRNVLLMHQEMIG